LILPSNVFHAILSNSCDFNEPSIDKR